MGKRPNASGCVNADRAWRDRRIGWRDTRTLAPGG